MTNAEARVAATVTTEQARTRFSEIIKRTQYGKSHTIITSYGKKAAAIIPVEELDLLEMILEKLEYHKDVTDARAALEEIEKEGTVSWDKIKADLDL